MVAFKNVFSKADINSITEYILSKQQGLRSVKRYAYADSIVNGKSDVRVAFQMPNFKDFQSS